MKRVKGVSLTAVTLMLQSAAFAQTVPLDAESVDAQCVTALNRFSHQSVTDQADLTNFHGMIYFFLGKLVGRHGTATAKPMLEAASDRVTADDVLP